MSISARVLLVSGLLLGTTSANFLAPHGATSSQTRSRAASELRSGMGWLARSLSDLLSSGGVPASLAHPTARAQLARKANLLEQQGQALKALLLHDLARRAPVEALVFMDDLEDTLVDATAKNFSESTRISRDAQGRIVTETTRCKNGKCAKTGSRSSDLTAPSKVLSFEKEKRRLLPGAADSAMEEELTEASERMATQMEGIFNNFGLDALHGMMDDIFGASLKAPSQMSWPFGSGTADGADLLEGAGGFEPQFDATMPMGSVSSSTVTKIVNGHMVQETTKCENGRCRRETHEEFGEPSMEETAGVPLLDEAVGGPAWAVAPSTQSKPMTILAKETEDV